MVSLYALVRVPLVDTLDSSPRVFIRALALEWRLSLFTVEPPRGRASDPAGVAPEPSREYLTPSRVILPNSQKRCQHSWWKVLFGFALRGGFDVLSIERASSTPD